MKSHTQLIGKYIYVLKPVWQLPTLYHLSTSFIFVITIIGNLPLFMLFAWFIMCQDAVLFYNAAIEYGNCFTFASFSLGTDFSFFSKWKRNASFLSLVSSQGPFNPWIPPFPGILQQQQQNQVPGLSPFSLSTREWFAGLVPNQIFVPGQVSFVQGTQAGQLDPSQPQTPQQTQRGPKNVSPASSN